MHLPTTTIVLPLKWDNSNLLNDSSQAFTRKFYCSFQKIKFLLVWFRWRYWSVKECISFFWHLMMLKRNGMMMMMMEEAPTWEERRNKKEMILIVFYYLIYLNVFLNNKIIGFSYMICHISMFLDTSSENLIHQRFLRRKCGVGLKLYKNMIV